MQCKHETWQNWVGNQRCTAEVCHASSLDDLRAIIQRASKNGQKIRVSGGGEIGSYSVSPVVTNESGVIIRVSRLNKGFVHPDGSGRITAQAGMTLKDLDRLATDNGLGFESSPVPDCIEVGGAVALGCHGTGYQSATFSDYIESIELLTHDGSTVKVSAQDDPSLMKAVRVNLGALGVVIGVTFQCVKRFKVSGSNENLDMKTTIANIKTLVEGNDYVEVFWLPFGKQVTVKKGNRVPWETPDKGVPGPWDETFQRINTAFQSAALHQLVKFPRLTPALMHFGMKIQKQGPITAPSPVFFHYQSQFPRGLSDVSYGFEIGANFENFHSAWNFTCDKICEYARPSGRCTSGWPLSYSRDGIFPQNSFMHARFIKHSDAYLAPSSGNAHTCMLQIITSSEANASRYLSDIEQHLLSLGGRPHWGKTYNVDLDFGKLYGDNLARFEQVRRQMDPNGLFLNAFLRRVFAAAPERSAMSGNV